MEAVLDVMKMALKSQRTETTDVPLTPSGSVVQVRNYTVTMVCV